MNKYSKLLIAFYLLTLFLFLSHCNPDLKRIEDISIKPYNNLEDNITHTTDLLSFDYKKYLLNNNKLKLDQEDVADIHFNKYIDHKTNTVFFRVVYNLSNEKIKKHVDKIHKIIYKRAESLNDLHYKKRNEFKLAINVCKAWLQLLDKKKYKQVFHLTGPAFKSKTSKEQFMIFLNQCEDKFGNLISRSLIFKQYQLSFNNEKGDFIFVQYLSDFEKKYFTQENIVLQKQNNIWKIIGYNRNISEESN